MQCGGECAQGAENARVLYTHTHTPLIITYHVVVRCMAGGHRGVMQMVRGWQSMPSREMASAEAPPRLENDLLLESFDLFVHARNMH